MNNKKLHPLAEVALMSENERLSVNEYVINGQREMVSLWVRERIDVVHAPYITQASSDFSFSKFVRVSDLALLFSFSSFLFFSPP